jgi:thiamine-phosphate pyrophosphorylase
MNKEILKLYHVTDYPDRYANGLLAGVEAAVEGGVTLVQYRADQGTMRERYDTALAIRDLLRPHKVPLIINNCVDLALAVDADGVHIGQNDLPAEVARRLLGRKKILGLSISTPEQMAEVNPDIVDYVGIGPVFPTISKMNAPKDVGMKGWGKLRAASPVPAVAIGGLNAEHIPELLKLGADGVAIVSAISRSPDPKAAAKTLLAAFGQSFRP